jgi:ATP-binding cassette, subfamily B, bacterial
MAEDGNNFTDRGNRAAGLRTLPRILTFLWEAAPGLIVTTGLLRTATAVIPLLVLVVSRRIIDMLVNKHPGGTPPVLWMLLAAEFVLVACASFCSRAVEYSDQRMATEFSRDVSLRVMDHASQLDLASLEDPEFYDRLERARVQATDRDVLFSSIGQLLQSAIMLAVMAIALATYSSWLLAVLVLCAIPAFSGESRFMLDAYALARRLTPLRRELDYLRTLCSSREAAKEVRIFNLGNYFQGRYSSRFEQVDLQTRSYAKFRMRWASVLGMIVSAGYYACYASLVIDAWHGHITIGTLTFLAGAVAAANSQLQMVFTQFSHVSEQALYLTDLVALLDTKPKIRSSPMALPAPRRIEHGIEFRNVSFHYPGSNRLILNNLNLRIDPGEHVALVGENGEGKTTLVKLVARLYEPTSGAILLDGVDLRDYSLEDLRRQFAIVFQDFCRYDFPLRENIGVGKVDRLRSDEALWEAANRSGMNGFVSRLPNGMDQMLGRRFEGGVDLSGGQWQRVALARAYIGDAQLLILDEPTAALDAAAEAEVFQKFADLMQDKTSIIISHRFSTVRMADRILVLADGQVAEEGTHSGLTVAGGRYARLFELQAANYR